MKREFERLLADVHMRAFATSVGFSGNQDALKKFDRHMRRELGMSAPATQLQRGLNEVLRRARAAREKGQP